MQSSDLLPLLRHMEWADALAWRGALALPPERAESSDLRARLFHIHLVQQAYLSMWRGQPFTTLPRLDDYPDLPALLRWARPFYAAAPALVTGANAARLASPVPVPGSERLAPEGGEVTHATFAETIVQVAMHTAYHRGQLATRLRELGGEPPLTDYVVWIWLARPEPRWPALDAATAP